MATLTAEFARSVIAQTDAVWQGDHQTGNEHAKRYIAAFRKIREVGDQGRDALAALLHHERPDVRVATAAYLLRHRTGEALTVLREAAQGEGVVAFEAGQAMKRWDEGTWALDLPDPS